MVDIISRASWGARSPRNRVTTTWNRRTEFFVHYADGPTTQTPRDIQRYHMGKQGWADIGYNFLVDAQGHAYEGRGWLTVGAHAVGHNTSGIGVCFIGYDGDATAAARRTIRALYDEANRRAGRTLAMRGHRDVNSTDCPGDQLYRWVRAGMPVNGSGGSTPPPTSETTAPRFPLRSGWYFGPRSGPNASVSGYYSHRSDLRTWQRRMRDRGWSLAADGLYGPRTRSVALAFQREKHLAIDGLIGPETWRAAWTSPIT
ncbi:peptidoglycan-binding domain-containing protein [Nocardiopsis gilva YIM 90087]|uniref:Peptidoglycan-binding domain-containing protein n=1 Tax=Nocardiopsis gilva YIM 90087 TaxID=1235441 RepID=A0A223SCY1_9ACTN|nr:peptidoglycan-binding domain-containing protein [Nocardiopsis gilva]ASU85945.1 peptidoglycan-binding domain-containing protein [Nocardiopsis gilva YIM 90087]